VRKAPTTYEDFISLELDGIRIGTVDQDSQRGAHAEQLQLGVHLAGLTAGAVDDAADVAELCSELVLERHLMMMHARTRARCRQCNHAYHTLLLNVLAPRGT